MSHTTTPSSPSPRATESNPPTPNESSLNPAKKNENREEPDFPWPPTFHALLCLGSGVVGGVVCLLVGGIAMGVQNVPFAATMGGWLLFALALVATYQAVRRGNRLVAWVLMVSFVWLLGITLTRSAQAFAGYLSTLQVHPPLCTGMYLVLSMAAISMLIMLIRVIRFPRPTSAQPWTIKGWVCAVAYLITVAVIPTLVAPRALIWRTHHQLASLQQELEKAKLKIDYPVEKKILMGAIGTAPALPLRLGLVHEALSPTNALNYMVELESIRATGTDALCIPVSGEGFLPGFPDPEFRQREQDHIARAREMGFEIILADVPSPHVSRHPVTWDAFCMLHQNRVMRYLEEVRPKGYFICTAMLTYHRFGNISTVFDRTIGFTDGSRTKRFIGAFLDMWREHLLSLAREIKRLHPKTLVGVTVQPWIPEEAGLYQELLNKPEIDLLGLQAFSTAQLESCCKMMETRGHPANHKQRCWLMGTWLGSATASTVEADLQAAWLAIVMEWARVNRVSAVFCEPNGLFAPCEGPLEIVFGNMAKTWDGDPSKLSAAGHTWREQLDTVGRKSGGKLGVDDF